MEDGVVTTVPPTTSSKIPPPLASDSLASAPAPRRDADHPDPQAGVARWNKYSASTTHLSARLSEQLRLLLAPTAPSRLSGDYRTGKRINMRRVVSYIASQYRKDKIWLRRSAPAKRTYQILLALDDSESMRAGGAGNLALGAVACLAGALTRLEAGELGVVSFGERPELLHPLGAPLSAEAAGRVMGSFGFAQGGTDMAGSLEWMSDYMERAKAGVVGDAHQLVFLISDGRFDGGGRERIGAALRRAGERGQLCVLVSVDGASGDPANSILATRTVSFVKGGKVVMTPYLEDYPFTYYLLLRHISSLPESLADALRQWFEMVRQQAD
jgi:midasin